MSDLTPQTREAALVALLKDAFPTYFVTASFVPPEKSPELLRLKLPSIVVSLEHWESRGLRWRVDFLENRHLSPESQRLGGLLEEPGRGLLSAARRLRQTLSHPSIATSLKIEGGKFIAFSGDWWGWRETLIEQLSFNSVSIFLGRALQLLGEISTSISIEDGFFEANSAILNQLSEGDLVATFHASSSRFLGRIQEIQPEGIQLQTPINANISAGSVLLKMTQGFPLPATARISVQSDWDASNPSGTRLTGEWTRGFRELNRESLSLTFPESDEDFHEQLRAWLGSPAGQSFLLGEVSQPIKEAILLGIERHRNPHASQWEIASRFGLLPMRVLQKFLNEGGGG